MRSGRRLCRYSLRLEKRFRVSTAFTAAELALAGIESVIPFEEVAESLGRGGKNFPKS